MTPISDDAKIDLAQDILSLLTTQPLYLWMGHLGCLFGQWVERGYSIEDAHDLTVAQCGSWIANGADLPERSELRHVGDDEIIELMTRDLTQVEPADGRPPIDDIGGILDLGCQFGQRVQLGSAHEWAYFHAGNWLVNFYGGENPWAMPTTPEVPTQPGPTPPNPIPPGGGGGLPGSGEGAMRRLEGNVHALGKSFADASGARIVHGCSDFAALVKYHEDRDRYLAQLDEVAKHQQYCRVLWRLNGWKWTTSGLTCDPIRDAWFDDALRGVLAAHRDRGLKVNLSSGDMNNWSDQQAKDSFTRVAQIAKEYGDTVWLSAITNEMEGTMSPGETDGNIERASRLMQHWVGIYPGGMQALSDPKDRDEHGMQRLAWTAALIHDIRHEVHDATRRAFNTMYENYPGFPIVQDEPVGPNGSPPHGEFTRLVYQPIDNPDALFAIYTVHILTGQASTYFNDPALVSRQPLHSTWGFQELPRLWRDLGVPQDIGQGTVEHGGRSGGMMQVKDSHASRADGCSRGAYHLGVISGSWDGYGWAVRANRDGQWSVWYSDGMAWEGRLRVGEVIPTSRGFTPAVVRCLT